MLLPGRDCAFSVAVIPIIHVFSPQCNQINFSLNPVGPLLIQKLIGFQVLGENL